MTAPASTIDVVRVRTRGELGAARELLAEYIGQQIPNYPDPGEARARYDTELASLRQFYSPFFLGLSNDRPAGCVGLRQETLEIGEMKRLYVREEFRGLGLGRELATAVLEAAREEAYERLRLDVHISRAPAIALYRSLRFQEVEPWDDPWAELLYMELVLT
ncbi:MAG: GNAT family N-acetyltransferase [Dehalococcoidia bacterium]